MAIRDRFRRAMRKSVSDGPISHTSTNLTLDSNTSNESDQSDFSFTPKRRSFLGRALPWGTRRSSRTDAGTDNSSADNSDSNDTGLTCSASQAERELKAEKKRMRKAKYKNAGKMHPRDKPLTAQNLRHQAMLGTWSWDESLSAAASNPRHSFASGISPCCTRPPSIHGDVDDDYYNNGGGSASHVEDAGPQETRT